MKETDGGRNHSDTKPAVKGTDSGGHLNNIVWEVEIVIWLAAAIARAGSSTFRKMLFDVIPFKPYKALKTFCLFLLIRENLESLNFSCRFWRLLQPELVDYIIMV